jgi:hypothetical protein
MASLEANRLSGGGICISSEIAGWNLAFVSAATLSLGLAQMPDQTTRDNSTTTGFGGQQMAFQCGCTGWPLGGA